MTYIDMMPGRQRVMRTGGNVEQWRLVWTVHISESKPGQTYFHRAQIGALQKLRSPLGTGKVKLERQGGEEKGEYLGFGMLK